MPPNQLELPRWLPLKSQNPLAAAAAPRPSTALSESPFQRSRSRPRGSTRPASTVARRQLIYPRACASRDVVLPRVFGQQEGGDAAATELPLEAWRRAMRFRWRAVPPARRVVRGALRRLRPPLPCPCLLSDGLRRQRHAETALFRLFI